MTLVKSVTAPLQDKIAQQEKNLLLGIQIKVIGANLPENPRIQMMLQEQLKRNNSEYDHEGHISDPKNSQFLIQMMLQEQLLKKQHLNTITRNKGPEKMTVYDPNDVARTTIKKLNYWQNA